MFLDLFNLMSTALPWLAEAHFVYTHLADLIKLSNYLPTYLSTPQQPSK